MRRRRQPTWRPDGDAYMKTEFLSSLAAPGSAVPRSGSKQVNLSRVHVMCMVVWSNKTLLSFCLVLFTFKRTELH